MMEEDFNTFILAKKTKIKRKTITLEQKLEVIKRYENNERTCDMVRKTGLSEATLRCIRNNADKIKKSCAVLTPSAAKTSNKIRPRLMDAMEKELVNWIRNQNSSISLLDIKSQALRIYGELKNCFPAESKLQFTASKGWFHRFKLRQRLHSIRHGNLKNIDSIKKKSVAESDTEQNGSSFLECDIKADVMPFPEKDVPQDSSFDLKLSASCNTSSQRQTEELGYSNSNGVEDNSCSNISKMASDEAHFQNDIKNENEEVLELGYSNSNGEEDNSCSNTSKMASDQAHFQNDIENENEEVLDSHIVRRILLKNLGQIEESLDNLQTLDSRVQNSSVINKKVRHLLKPYYHLLEQKLAQLSDESNMSNDETYDDSEEYQSSFNLKTVIHESNNPDRNEIQESFGVQGISEVVLPV